VKKQFFWQFGKDVAFTTFRVPFAYNLWNKGQIPHNTPALGKVRLWAGFLSERLFRSRRVNDG
jgi:hypothetical protein